ncbi:hypothetical protein [Labrys sp. (in: a-proteobacteria)]|uniref:hypothetical protein n=1 Tax=Labrys sp. (in: a-proteobacteria) TaxID=1917972 RepID=UPI0039E41E17
MRDLDERRDRDAWIKPIAARLYHVGGVAVPRSTLDDANRVRPSTVFCEPIPQMVAQTQHSLYRATNDTVEQTEIIQSQGTPCTTCRFQAGLGGFDE